MGRFNTLNTPSDIKAKVAEIMSRNTALYGGFQMSLDGIVAPDPVVPPVNTPPAPPVGSGDEFFTKADIDAAMEKARQQEKEKLYGRLEGLTNKLSEWEQREADRAAAEEKARLQAEQEAKAKEEENLSARDLLARKEQEWQAQIEAVRVENEQRLSQIQQERENERALLEKEREFASLQAYTQRRLVEEQENIAPQLVDFVNGSTADEIEQSIATAKAKSAEIAEAARQALLAARSQQRGTSVTGFPPVGPLETEGGTRQYSAQDIAAMDMNQYAKLRQQVPGLGSQTHSNRGLFG